MADPFSIIASVAGLATAALKSSKASSELMNDIKGSTKETKSDSREVHAYYTITYSSNIILKTEATRDAMSGDEATIEMIDDRFKN